MTIGSVAKRLDVTTQTVRGWADEYSDFLSSDATPAKGSTRSFNDDDLKVLVLVASMRADGESFDSIRLALANGRRGTMILPMVPSDESEAGEPRGSAIITRLATTAARYEGEIKQLADERNRLAGELEREREARIAAIERAARAEASQPLPTPTDPRSVMVWRWVLVAALVVIIALLIWQVVASV